MIALPLAAGLFYVDGPIAAWAAEVRGHLGGDLRRSIEMLQQYGDVVTLLITALLVSVLDPARRRFLLDLAGAAILTGLAAVILKMVCGRPRPELGDSSFFAGPFLYPVTAKGAHVLLHSWEFWKSGASDLWSMPSSHTTAAAVLSVFLAYHYPRLRVFAGVMVVFVACARVLTGAHYASDVVMGAGVGCAVAWSVLSTQWLSQRFGSRRFGAAQDLG